MKIIKQKLIEELKEFLNNNSIDALAEKIIDRFDIDDVDYFIFDLSEEVENNE
ncbi:TPA: hypothetical protein ACF2DE_002813 [Clostridium perfringens]